MKKQNEFDESILSDEKAFKKRLKKIERPAFLGKPKPKTAKLRVTIYLDEDIVAHYKYESETSSTHEGYQTLINSALRSQAFGEPKNALLESLLKDKDLLRRLKAELESV